MSRPFPSVKKTPPMAIVNDALIGIRFCLFFCGSGTWQITDGNFSQSTNQIYKKFMCGHYRVSSAWHFLDWTLLHIEKEKKKFVVVDIVVVENNKRRTICCNHWKKIRTWQEQTHPKLRIRRKVWYTQNPPPLSFVFFFSNSKTMI